MATFVSLCIQAPEDDCTLTQLESQIKKIVHLKQVLELLPSLHEILDRSSSTICKETCSMFEKNVNSSSLLLEMMSLVLFNDSNFKMSGKENKFGKFSVIRPEVNGLLDMARASFYHYIGKMENQITELNQVNLWKSMIFLTNFI